MRAPRVLGSLVARQPRHWPSWLSLPSPITLLGPGFALLTLFIVGLLPATTIEELMRDPASVAHFPFYYGMISYLGILAWCVGASVCFFSAYLLGGKLAQFLCYAGGLTTLLLFDDLFLLHEGVAPQLFVHGVWLVERYDTLLYIAPIVAFFALFWRQMLRTRLVLLLVAFASLGLSLLFDVFDVTTLDYYLEDGLKFFGIVMWSTYLVNSALLFLQQRDQIPRSEG